MAKGRQSGKRTSSATLVLIMLLTLSVVTLLLLALGTLSLPVGSGHVRPAHHLTSFDRRALERSAGMGKRGEQWIEILSWEP